MRRAVPEPQALVASLRDAEEPRLVLLTGGRGSSKTRWCLALREVAESSGLAVAGVISPPVYADGGKVAIDVLDAATGARRRLATRPAPNEVGTVQAGAKRSSAANWAGRGNSMPSRSGNLAGSSWPAPWRRALRPNCGRCPASAR